MRNVDIEVFCTAQTQVNRDEVRRWLYFIGASGFEIPTDEACSDPALLIALAAKRCYMSFEPGLNPNVTKVRKNLTEYLDNVLKSGHGSVLEHACYTFAIENISRVFTGEMNRHRAGVGISEGSMRYIRYRDIPWWLPTSITLTKEEEELAKLWTWIESAIDDAGFSSEEERKAVRLMQRKVATQKVFERHFNQTEVNYQEIQDIWKEELAPDSKFHGKKQITSMARRIIPMGVATGGVWTMNLRAVRHIVALRASEAAEEEIAYVFGKIAKYICEQEPMLMGDFTQDDNGFWTPKYKKV
ncbi:MAG: FAD-dependent thymidylate synthase [Azonexus sp.]